MFPKAFACNFFRSLWSTYPHLACSSQWNLGELMSHGSCRAQLSGPEAALTPSLPRISYHSVFGFIVSGHAWHMCTHFFEQEFIKGIKQNYPIFLQPQSSAILQSDSLLLLSTPSKLNLFNIYRFIQIFHFSKDNFKKLYFSRKKINLNFF